jgi:hypothetical protein
MAMRNIAQTRSTVTAGTEIQIGTVGRAKRFEIEVPVMYRAKGESEWRTGKSKNISRTGVMFVAEDSIPVGTELEIHIVLNGMAAPQPEAEPATTPVACKGEVVRNVLVPWPEVFPTIGARFSDHDFGD